MAGVGIPSKGQGERLVVVETHPVQYRVPVYRFLQAKLGIPLVVIYGSDFSVSGYRDREFQSTFAWDTDLLTGYKSVVLNKARAGSPPMFLHELGLGFERAVGHLGIGALLLTGYRPPLEQRAFLYGIRNRIPILFRAEVSDHAERRGRVKSLLRDGILRRIYGRCFRVLPIGQRARQHFGRLGVEGQRMVFSPYCVDTDVFRRDDETRVRWRQKIRQSLDIGDHQDVLLFSGKLSRRKGVDLLLPAIALLPPEIQEQIVLLFMGSGKLEVALKQQAKGFPSGRVRFLGFQNQTHLSRHYLAADLLVLPSRRSETWGLVVNEALWHGVPAVVSEQVGCAPDLIEPGRTGEIYRGDSARDLSAAIQRGLRWIGQPEVREWCWNKIEGYSVGKAAEGIARAYEEALSLGDGQG